MVDFITSLPRLVAFTPAESVSKERYILRLFVYLDNKRTCSEVNAVPQAATAFETPLD